MASSITNPIVQIFAQAALSSTFFNGTLEHKLVKSFGLGSGSGQLDRVFRSNFAIVASGTPSTFDLSALADPLDGTTNAMLHWNLIVVENDGTSNQTITVTGSPAGGTFTLTYGGQTTATIAYNAAASAVQSALEALSTIGTGNVVVTGSGGGPYTAVFASSLGSAVLTASGAGLTGGSTPSVTIAQVDISLTIGGGSNPIFAAAPVTLQGFGDAQAYMSNAGKLIDASTAHNLKITSAGGANVPGKLTIWGRST